jgi:hypothetical protein
MSLGTNEFHSPSTMTVHFGDYSVIGTFSYSYDISDGNFTLLPVVRNIQ